MKKSFVFVLCCLLSIQLFAQTTTTSPKLAKLQNWQLLDHQQDSVYGASVNRAYKELLKGKKSHTVIVAVIDEGVDITHEDLQGLIWTNRKEIPGNRIDDDKNGYTDDVHGWNFLGGKNGQIMHLASSEADREYWRLQPVFGKIKDTTAEAGNKNYEYFLRIRKKHFQDSTGRNQKPSVKFMKEDSIFKKADSLIKKRTGKQDIFLTDIAAFVPADSLADSLKSQTLKIYALYPTLKTLPLDSLIIGDLKYISYLKEQKVMYAQLNGDPFELRKEIIGDDPFDINDRYYGNNNVGDANADHGTHCSGIIAAVRNNGIGMDGVADNVLIMPVLAVNSGHLGDEYDKDIALAIRYAVDNGAQIISMSFGKNFSPQKKWVDDAIKYADEKGVLLIHAAMNNHDNVDSTDCYPNPYFLNSSGVAKNFINVGAISIDTGLMLAASFSNYGQLKVDIFAPGVDIYSSVPGNKYQFKSGTSMATPVVAGVAALIMEYYPRLSALQVKDIIMHSVTSLKGKIVYKPGTKQKVDFATLCVSGGVVNAYQALQLAEKYK